MNGLMLDTPGSHFVTREQLAMIETPPATSSYTPVKYAELLDMVEDTAKDHLGLDVLDLSLGVAGKGARFFGTMSLDTQQDDRGMMIGFRSSLNKSMGVAIATGSKVFVCSNMCFAGDAVVVMRRQTTNVWETLRSTIVTAIQAASQSYEDMDYQIGRLREKPVALDRGYELLGRMYGHRLISAPQLKVAAGDWRSARHEEFAEQNAWSLYNCVTEGLKSSDRGRMLTAHTRAHDYLTETLNVPKRPLGLAFSERQLVDA